MRPLWKKEQTSLDKVIQPTHVKRAGYEHAIRDSRGPVFLGRPDTKMVLDKHYFHSLLASLHRNPVEGIMAGLYGSRMHEWNKWPKFWGKRWLSLIKYMSSFLPGAGAIRKGRISRGNSTPVHEFRSENHFIERESDGDDLECREPNPEGGKYKE